MGDEPFKLNARTDGDGALSFVSGNPEVVTIDESGKAEIVAAGTAEVLIIAAETNRYREAKTTITITVIPEGYQPIYDIADLYGIRNDLSGNYILMKDIDMSKDTAEGGDWNLEGHGWTPIDGFKGTLDGNGHRIIGMHIYGDMGNRRCVGLFGDSERSVQIQNLAMENVSIDVTMNTDYFRIGSIIGCTWSGNMEQCYASGKISVSDNYIGDDAVGNSHAIGGLVGGGSIQGNNLYNGCSMSLDDSKSSKYIEYQIGGIIGGGAASECKNCYNTGIITRTDAKKTYPIAGYSTYYNANDKNSYYLSGTANTNNSGCTTLLETQLKDKRTLVGFDFDNVWEIDPYCDAYPYPQLKNNRQIRIDSLKILSQPAKTEYEQGDALEFSDGKVQINYEDGTNVTLPITKDMISGYDMNVIGKQNVVVTYGGVSTTYPITVKEVSLKKITLNQSSASLRRNATLQLTVNYIPGNASDKTIEWKSSDSSIVKVDSNGLVTAKNRGTAVITAVSAEGLTAQCEIEVLIPCAAINLNKTSAKMKVGDSLRLTAQLLPLDTTDVLEWKTSNSTVADVYEGTVTAYSAGTAKITAYAGSGVSVTCTVTVESNKVPDGSGTASGGASTGTTSGGTQTGTTSGHTPTAIVKGTSFTSGAGKYKVTGSSTVAFTGLKNKKTTKITIPATVKYSGKSFKVTSIADKAFQKTKMTNVTVGKNVTKIGKNAFYKCGKLKSITIKSTKLKSVGKNALKGIKSTAKIKVPSKKLNTYKKLLKGKGQGKKVKIVK